MHAGSDFLRVARLAVSGVIFGVVVLGVMVGGIVPALPIELATLCG